MTRTFHATHIVSPRTSVVDGGGALRRTSTPLHTSGRIAMTRGLAFLSFPHSKGNESMFQRTTTLTFVGLLLPAVTATAQTVTVEQIPFTLSAIDMSPNGQWIIGTADQDENGTADGQYLYDTMSGEITFLPPGANDVSAVSDNGRVIVGCMPDPVDGAEVACMWTAETNAWVSLGYLENAGTCPSRSNAYDVSGDGTVVTGLSWEGCSGRGFRWTAEQGMIELLALANGSNRSSIISSDGTVMAGFAQGTSSRTPAMWDDEAFGVLLDPPNGDATGEVRGISDDGTVMLGNWNELAFRYTEGGGLETVGAGRLLPGWVGAAMDIADNGTVVGFDFLLGNRRSWIQPNGEGDLVEMTAFIEANGTDVPDGQFFQVARAISADGRRVIGLTFGSPGWIVNIEPACDADTNNDGVVNVTDLVNVILDWDTDGAGNGGDVNGDGVVNVTDLVEVILQWGAC